MKVRSVSGKILDMDVDRVGRKQLNEFDEDLKQQLNKYYKEYVYFVIGYAKQLKKRIRVFITKDDYLEIKKQLNWEKREFIQRVLKKKEMMIDSHDERWFRKGLKFDWR